MRATRIAPATVVRERLAADFALLAEITATPGAGITRLAFSPEDARARRLVRDLMADAGLVVRVDATGNIIGRRPGLADDRPPVMTGSHIDSVPRGGNFDGPVGVLGAVEAIRALNDAGLRTVLPIEVVCFASEEAPRFSQSGHRFGSRVMAGLFDLSAVHRLRDTAGTTLAEALRAFELDPDGIGAARRQAGDISAFVELHIEQGELLAQAGRPVGLVTCITGTTRYRVEIQGRADHSGGTPMARRRDALAAAAEVVLAVERIAHEIGGSLVATVGTLEVESGSISVVPGRAVLGIDIRDIRAQPKREAAQRILTAIEEDCVRRSVRHAVHTIRDDPPVELSERIRGLSEQAAADYGIGCQPVPSHTGHDAASISHISETGMIFVRNTSGRSHSPDEHVDLDDIAAGAQVLLGTLLRLAEPAAGRAPGRRPVAWRGPLAGGQVS